MSKKKFLKLAKFLFNSIYDVLFIDKKYRYSETLESERMRIEQAVEADLRRRKSDDKL